jgi:hypothetical protein
MGQTTRERALRISREMPYRITEHGTYIRGVIGDAASLEDFVRFYKEVQALCALRRIARALVVVQPENELPGPDRLGLFGDAGFVDGFRLALVCTTWTLYRACNRAEQAASEAAIRVRAFLQEMEAVRWLTS